MSAVHSNSAPSALAPESGTTRLRQTLPKLVATGALIGFALWGWLSEWHFGLVAKPHGVTNRTQAIAPVTTTRIRNDLGSAVLADIEFSSAEEAERLGIDIAPVLSGPIAETVSASGEVRFDPARIARLSARTSGTAWRVLKTTGDTVRAGELLALVDAAEVGRAKAEFLQALVQARLARVSVQNALLAGTALSEPQRREVEAAARNAEVKLLSAEQALVNLGLPLKAADLRDLPSEVTMERVRHLGIAAGEVELGIGQTATLLPIRSSLDGVVLSSDVVTGEVVDTSRVLFVVVDPRRVWLTLHVPEDRLSILRIGQKVEFRPDGLGQDFGGSISWIGTSADETTRMIPIRAEVDNQDGRLRASTLGRGRIIIREEKDAVLVPSSAVVGWSGGSLIFLRNPDYLKPGQPKSFQVRVVLTGARDGANTEIRAGLKAGDVVASKGAALLFDEFKRVAGGAPGLGRVKKSDEHKPTETHP